MIERAPALAPAKVPRHVAIVMDGSRSWAAERGLSAREGDRAGALALHDVVRASAAAGIEFLTVHALSGEDGLFDAFAGDRGAQLASQNVRAHTFGRIASLPAATRRALATLVETTAGCTGLMLNLAVDYGGRRELCDAIRTLAREVADGKLDPAQIDGEAFASRLYTAGLPDPDLLIRTGGELRVANFLLYQIAYTELWATPVPWPAFDALRLDEALRAYAARQRRFGT